MDSAHNQSLCAPHDAAFSIRSLVRLRALVGLSHNRHVRLYLAIHGTFGGPINLGFGLVLHSSHWRARSDAGCASRGLGKDHGRVQRNFASGFRDRAVRRCVVGRLGGFFDGIARYRMRILACDPYRDASEASRSSLARQRIVGNARDECGRPYICCDRIYPGCRWPGSCDGHLGRCSRGSFGEHGLNDIGGDSNRRGSCCALCTRFPGGSVVGRALGSIWR